MKSIKFFSINLILYAIAVINNPANAQNIKSLKDTIYSGVTIHLTPDRPLASEIYTNNLLRKISLALTKNAKNIEDTNSLSSVKKDSVIIKLISDTSWELTGQSPKTPVFFLLRLIINNKNEKVKQRLEYLMFNSLCEQKPDSVYLVIDRIVLYRNYNNVSYKYIFTIDVNNNLKILE